MELPIFPLKAVLFPGATLPLHIFEERYQAMINHCIETGAPFGVCLIQSGAEVGPAAQPFETGTTAHITSVQRLEGGRMNITCTGGNRFTIRRVTQQAPYLVADVEILGRSPEPESAAEALIHTAGELFAEYMRLNLAVVNQWSRSIEMPSGPAALSDYIAPRLTVGLPALQRLLEEPSPKTRLQLEIEYTASLIRQLTHRVQRAQTSRWNGFGVLN